MRVVIYSSATVQGCISAAAAAPAEPPALSAARREASVVGEGPAGDEEESVHGLFPCLCFYRFICL